MRLRQAVLTLSSLATFALVWSGAMADPLAAETTSIASRADGPLSAERVRHATAADLDSLNRYVRRTWQTLTRTPADLPRAALDATLQRPGGRPLVYVARREDLAAISQNLENLLSEEAFARLDLRRLPIDHRQPAEPGLLYLPYPYVVATPLPRRTGERAPSIAVTRSPGSTTA